MAMVGLIISMVGAFAFYSKSKYFPGKWFSVRGKLSPWLGAVLLLSVLVIYIMQYGTFMGLLISTAAIPTAYCLLVFLFNLPKKWVMVCLGFLGLFLCIDLFL